MTHNLNRPNKVNLRKSQGLVQNHFSINNSLVLKDTDGIAAPNQLKYSSK